MNKGLFDKYIIKKTDGSPVDRMAQYFVLRLDTDLHARKALRVYADSIAAENPILAIHLRTRLDFIETAIEQKILGY